MNDMINETTKENTAAPSPEALTTEFLTPSECEFFTSPGGFLGAAIRGETHKRVILARALPLTKPGEYICVSDVDKKELGIIERLSDFSEDQRKLMLSELSMRYYCPAIDSIESIKEKMGQFYFDVTIGGKKKSFTVKDISKSIRMAGGGIDITDIDANRYRIRDLGSIPAKSRRKLEPYIY